MCGMCANIAPVFLKLLIHDKHTLGAESDAYTCAIPPNAATCAIPRGPCARDRVRHDCAAAVVATGVEAHMPAEPVDLKDVQTPLPHHARSSTRGVPSLPAIRSGTAICFDEFGKVVAVDADGSSTGSQRHAASAPDDGAAGSSSDVDRDPVDATATAAPDHGVQGWLQSNHMQEHAADAADSPFFVGPLQGGAAREDVREPLLGPATGPPSRDDCAGATPGATPAHTMWTCWPERLVLGPHWVPYLMFSADLISGLASGMTIKFFPIFFMDKVIVLSLAAPRHSLDPALRCGGVYLHRVPASTFTPPMSAVSSADNPKQWMGYVLGGRYSPRRMRLCCCERACGSSVFQPAHNRPPRTPCWINRCTRPCYRCVQHLYVLPTIHHRSRSWHQCQAHACGMHDSHASHNTPS